MNWVTTLVLVLSAVVLTVLFELDASDRQFHFQTDLDQPFGSYRPDAFTGFEFEREGSKIRIERDASGQWWLEEPVRYPASEQFTTVLIDLVRDLRVRHVVGEDDGAFGTGTSPDRVIVHVGNSTKTLRFGESTTDIELSYVYTAFEDQIVLFDDALALAVRQVEVDSLRSRRVVRTSFADMTRVRFLDEQGVPAVTLTKRAEGDWRLGEDAMARAGRAIVEVAIRDQLLEYRAAGFVASGPSVGTDPTFGFVPPRATIEIESESGVERIFVGSTMPNTTGDVSLVHLLREGEPVVLAGAGTLFDLLEIPEAEYHERRLFPVAANTGIRSVTAIRDGITGTIERAEDEARARISGDVLPPADDAIDRLERLRNAVVTDWIAPDPSNPTQAQELGFAPHTMELVVANDDGGTERLYVGRVDVTECIVRGAEWGPGRFARVQFPDREWILAAPHSFRTRSVVPTSEDRIFEVEIEDRRGRQSYIRIKAGGVWRRESDRSEVEDPEWNSIVQALSTLRVSAWATGAVAADFVVESTWTVRARGQEIGTEEHRFEIGTRGADGQRIVRVTSSEPEIHGVLEPWIVTVSGSRAVEIFSLLEVFLERESG